MRIVLTGPISLGGKLSQEEVEKNKGRFREVAEALRADSHFVVFNPVELEAGKTWADYMRLTIAAVIVADYLVLLEGWEESKGAMIEVFLAQELEIPIVTKEFLRAQRESHATK